MTNLAVTNTFVSGAIITASGHNTNYSDIVNYINNRNTAVASWDGVSVASSTIVPLTVDNGTGTQNIFEVLDNGAGVLVVKDGGYVDMAGQPRVRAYRSSNQSISAGTGQVTFNAETYDLKGEFAAGVYTAGHTGLYLFTATVAVSIGATDVIQLTLIKNGVTAVAATFVPAVSGVTPSVCVADIQSMTAADTMEVSLTCTNNMTVTGTEFQTFFTVYKLA